MKKKGRGGAVVRCLALLAFCGCSYGCAHRAPSAEAVLALALCLCLLIHCSINLWGVTLFSVLLASDSYFLGISFLRAYPCKVLQFII